MRSSSLLLWLALLLALSFTQIQAQFTDGELIGDEWVHYRYLRLRDDTNCTNKVEKSYCPPPETFDLSPHEKLTEYSSCYKEWIYVWDMVVTKTQNVTFEECLSVPYIAARWQPNVTLLQCAFHYKDECPYGWGTQFLQCLGGNVTSGCGQRIITYVYDCFDRSGRIVPYWYCGTFVFD